MATITFAHVSYRIDGTCIVSNSGTRDHGKRRIIATDVSGTYPAGQEWRANVHFTRHDTGYFFASNNVGTFITNPDQVAAIDAALAQYETEQAAPAPQAPADLSHDAEYVARKRAEIVTNAPATPRPITDEMVATYPALRFVALAFVRNYKGFNTFVQSLAVNLIDYGTLTVPQLRGALNVMVAEDRSAQTPKPAPDAFKIDFAAVPMPAGIRTFNLDGTPAYDTPIAPAPVASNAPVVPNGTYTVPINDSGDYRVIRLTDCPEKYNKPAGTQIAAFQSGADNENDYTGFAFVMGTDAAVWRKFTNAREIKFALVKLLTTGRHGEFGKLWAMASKKCFICGRKLTVEISKRAGIGPKCAENVGIDIEALAALNVGNNERAARAKAQADIDELFPDR